MLFDKSIKAKQKIAYAYDQLDAKAALSRRRRFIKFLSILALLTLLSLLGKRYAYLHNPANDPYARTPMCHPHDGRCGEDATLPSPRTIYSAKSKKNYEQWWYALSVLNKAVKEYVNARAGDELRKEKIPFILFGDSITEFWTGKEYGESGRAQYAGVPAIFHELFDHTIFDTLALGVSGDQTQHLLYRLVNNDELHPAYASDPYAVFVVLIGTNNLGAGMTALDAVRGIMTVVEYIMKNIKGKLILMEVLPRGDQERIERLCPPRCDAENKPLKSFMPAVSKVNKAMRKRANDFSSVYGERFVLLNCGGLFTGGRSGEEVNIELMGDRLHPSAEGYNRLGKCILDCVSQGYCSH